MTDDEINKEIEILTQKLSQENISCVLLAMHKDKKSSCLRMFGIPIEVVALVITALNTNPMLWDIVLNQMAQIEQAKLTLLMKDGGNT